MANDQYIKTNPPVHYKKLKKSESIIIFKKLIEKEACLIVWRKGDTDGAFEVFSKSFDFETGHFYLDSERRLANLSKFYGKKVFIKAILNKVTYFAYTTLKYSKKVEKFYLMGMDSFYSCQLRKNIRVMTGPKFKVNAMIDTVMFSVIDLSISGMKLFVPEKKRENFLKGVKIPTMEILLMGNVFTITNSEVRRQENGQDPRSGSPCGVIALKFGNVPRKVEMAIFRELNSIVFLRNKNR